MVGLDCGIDLHKSYIHVDVQVHKHCHFHVYSRRKYGTHTFKNMALIYHMWRYAEATSSGLSAGILQTPVARVHMFLDHHLFAINIVDSAHIFERLPQKFLQGKKI